MEGTGEKLLIRTLRLRRFYRYAVSPAKKKKIERTKRLYNVTHFMRPDGAALWNLPITRTNRNDSELHARILNNCTTRFTFLVSLHRIIFISCVIECTSGHCLSQCIIPKNRSENLTITWNAPRRIHFSISTLTLPMRVCFVIHTALGNKFRFVVSSCSKLARATRSDNNYKEGFFKTYINLPRILAVPRGLFYLK